MQECNSEKSIPKRNSRTPSTATSTTDIKSLSISKKRILHKSLSVKQAVFSSHLVNYSQILLKKIPCIAKRWAFIDKRILQIKTDQQTVQCMLELYKEYNHQEKQLKILKSRVKKRENYNNIEKEQAYKLLEKYNNLQNRSHYSERQSDNLIQVALDSKRIELNEILDNIKEYKNELLNDFNHVTENQEKVNENLNNIKKKNSRNLN